MSDTNNGGPAFPRPASDAHSHGMHNPQTGMTLRDYFAAQFLSSYRLGEGSMLTTRDVATACYQVADAMLEARK